MIAGARWLCACALALALVGAGCFDSLVGSPCVTGYELVSGRCIEMGVGPDGGPGDGGAGGDALVCALPEVACDGACRDVRADPDNCGACGRRCESGLCVDARCVGGLSGHVIAIGHDYQRHHASMARVLGNAIALAPSQDVGLARWRGTVTPSSDAGTSLAISSSLAELGRPWHDVPLPASPSSTALLDVDVLVIEAQTGDGDAAAAAAAAWAGEIDRFLARGGVVIVLHGASGVSHRAAEGAGLYTIGAPVEVVGELARVVDGQDAVAQRVVSPYLAEPSSVIFPDVSAAVVSTTGGATLVFHQTRP